MNVLFYFFERIFFFCYYEDVYIMLFKCGFVGNELYLCDFSVYLYMCVYKYYV